MAPPAEGELVPVGVVSKPHGVKGEVRLHPFNADSPLWGKKQKKRLAEAFLAAPGEGPRPCVVTSARKGPKYVILTLEGVVGREAADALRGHELHIPREALPPLAEDEFYLLDLEGLALERDGERVGEVARVLESPSRRVTSRPRHASRSTRAADRGGKRDVEGTHKGGDSWTGHDRWRWSFPARRSGRWAIARAG